jgi:hypothetical protein
MLAVLAAGTGALLGEVVMAVLRYIHIPQTHSLR